MVEYFLSMIEGRRRIPGHDLISALLTAEIDGQQLTVHELLGFCALLLVAGNETTTNLIGNAVLTFTEHPGTIERLLAEPGTAAARDRGGAVLPFPGLGHVSGSCG